jgi:uncharacterized protein
MTDPLVMTDAEVAELDALLARVPPPLDALDTCALDGFLCGVLLQPKTIALERWWPWVVDVDARPWPAGADPQGLASLRHLVLRRHTELDRCIETRQWFDPWVYEIDDPTLTAAQMTLPWVAGFATAMDQFPELMALEEPALMEPLAVLYAAFDPQDLEEADELLALIDTLEPPATLSEATEDLVRSVLLLADVTRPVRARPASRSGRPRHHNRRGPAA